MSRFDDFIPFVLKAECDYPDDKTGQYSNDPDDPGSETKFGIDKASHPLVDIPSLTVEGAIDIYRNEWLTDGIENIDCPLGEIHFDTCVNNGVSAATKILVQCDDDPRMYLSMRRAYYHSICESWESQGKANPYKFLEGWLNRINDLKQFLTL